MTRWSARPAPDAALERGGSVAAQVRIGLAFREIALRLDDSRPGRLRRVRMLIALVGQRRRVGTCTGLLRGRVERLTVRSARRMLQRIGESFGSACACGGGTV